MKYTILPHLEGKIRPGENCVYCPTFQMAWDSLVTNMLKAPLQVQGDPEIARILNRNRYDPGNVDSNSVLIDSGYIAEGIVEDIKRRFVEKFGYQEAVIKMLDGLPPAVTPRDLLTFAYLEALLGFRQPFYVYETPLHFHSGNGLSKVESFGVSVLCTNASANRQRWRPTEGSPTYPLRADWWLIGRFSWRCASTGRSPTLSCGWVIPISS
jgi:hypothetical protein